MRVTDRSLGEFVAAITSDSTLGGGSTAAVSGAMAAALSEMACSVTVESDRGQDAAVDLVEIRAELATERTRLLELADEDAEAFEALLAAYRQTDGDPGTTVEQASERAASVPLDIADRCLTVLEHATLVAAEAESTVSDARASGYLAHAGLQAAVDTAKANFDAIEDDEFVETARKRVEQLRANARKQVVKLGTAEDDR